MSNKRFILWDDNNGTPTLEDSGIFGVIGEDNVYLTAYPKWLQGMKHTDLSIGESTLARYSLSGRARIYRVMRVKDDLTSNAR